MNEGHVYRTLDPLKDIEAVHPDNAGLLALGQPRFVPSTPSSVFWMLDRYVEDSGRDPTTFYNGLDLVLVGRSNNVGKPALWLGLARNATVISAHHHTAQAGRLERTRARPTSSSSPPGVPHLITGEMVKPGAIVIDVGINPERDPETGKVRMVGDVDTESVADVAEAVSPVPGGVGPITDVSLLREHRARGPSPGPDPRGLTLPRKRGSAEAEPRAPIPRAHLRLARRQTPEAVEPATTHPPRRGSTVGRES